MIRKVKKIESSNELSLFFIADNDAIINATTIKGINKEWDTS